MPVLPGHQGREGLHPRPRPGAAGARQRHAGPAASARPSWPSRSTCACPARAARRTARPGVDMATYKAEVLYQRYRRRLRPAAHYSLGWLPRWARLAVARAAGWPTPRCATRPWPALAKRLGGIDARRPLPQFAAQTLPRLVRRPARAARGRARCCCGSTRSPTTSRPRSARPPCGCSRRPATRCRSPTEPVCCGLTWISTGQLDGARRQLRRSLDALDAGAAARHPDRRARTVLHRRAARRDHRAAARRPARRAGRAPRPARWPSCWPAPSGWTPPDLDGVHAVAQPHCHQHAVMGWHADAALLAAAGAEVNAVGGCCGLAGNFGVERGHYDVSVAVAETALLPAVRDGRRTRSCWPTGSPAAPSSTSSPASAASTWPSCWPAAWRIRRPDYPHPAT